MAAGVTDPVVVPVLHDIGEPTDQEQYLLELINKVRDNPAGEGARLVAETNPDVLPNYEYYGLNLQLPTLLAEFALLSKSPPLAPNKFLIKAARDHSQWMLGAQLQLHEEDLPGGRIESVEDRFKRQGYLLQSTPPGPDPGAGGENIYAYGVELDELRAAFEADWGFNDAGQSDHGMQTGRPHRVVSHSGMFREVGVGIVNGLHETPLAQCTDTSLLPVGPMLVTEEYARTFGATNVPFVTGVAWYDFDGNGFYTPGEGIGGVSVSVTGAAESAVTSKSGAYAIPRAVTGNSQPVTVTFSGLGFSLASAATLTNKQNVKVDLKPAYTPPTPAGAATVARGVPATFTFPTVPGATGYTLAVGTKAAAPAWDGSSFTKAAVDTAGAVYTTIDPTVATTTPGSSWHLAHPYDPQCQIIRPQTVLLTPQFLCTSGTKLNFKSRLRGARNGQTAKVQVSWDGGVNWKTEDFQRGFLTGNGETAFRAWPVNLGAYAGKLIRVRFAYTGAASGSYAVGATPADGGSSAYGWFVDDVSFATVGGAPTTHEVTLTDKGAVSGGSFTYTPTATGSQQLYVRPVISGKNWPYSPPLEITVVEPTGYLAAAVARETAAGLPAGTFSANPAADADGDGLPNLVEYALKLNLAGNNSNARPLIQTATPPAGKGEVTWQRDTTVAGVSLTIQASLDGTHWFTPGQAGAPAGLGLADAVTTAGSIETHRSSAFHQGNTLLFRLKATAQ